MARGLNLPRAKSQRVSLPYENSPNESNLKDLSVCSCLTEDKNCEIADFILVVLVL